MNTPYGLIMHAKPDCSSFWLAIGIHRQIAIYLEFTPQNGVSSSLKIEHDHQQENLAPHSLTDQDIDALLFGVATAIELYTSLYPERPVLCNPEDPIQSLIFRIMLRNRGLLEKAFSINFLGDADKIDWTDNGETCIAFTLKRIRDTPPAHLGESKQEYTVDSLLFGFPISVHTLIQVQIKSEYIVQIKSHL